MLFKHNCTLHFLFTWWFTMYKMHFHCCVTSDKGFFVKSWLMDFPQFTTLWCGVPLTFLSVGIRTFSSSELSGTQHFCRCSGLVTRVSGHSFGERKKIEDIIRNHCMRIRKRHCKHLSVRCRQFCSFSYFLKSGLNFQDDKLNLKKYYVFDQFAWK